MKKTAKILALVLLVVTAMVSCIKNNSASNGNQNANLIVGKWKCVSYSDDDEHFSWAKIGDIWEFSSDGTLDFVIYYEESHRVEQISAHYICSERWLSFFASSSSIYNGTDSFEIIEISRNDLTLECQSNWMPCHIVFEKVD